MRDINKIFFELIRVALGNAVCLSHTPTAKEWQMLYEMAKKQSLVGICFAGVQLLQEQQQCPPEQLYLQWMGTAAKIQQRNDVVNRQCVDVQKRLAMDGFRSSILKGQGIASLYGEHLRGLRQSGDIDVYVQGGLEKALEYCKEKFGKVKWDYINAHVPFFNDTEVEVHWRVQSMTNLFANKKLQEWLEREDVKAMMAGGKVRFANGGEIVVPTNEFNAFYILLHCYHHMFESGLGLRQLMDYYFVLVAYANENDRELSANFPVNALFEEFGMMRFAKGVMWIMKHVFGLEQECLLCEADEKEGRFLLKEVMQNGNFGHHDERIKKMGSGKMSELWRNVQHNWHLASHYPSEFLWQSIWLCYHFIWKRNLKLNTR